MFMTSLRLGSVIAGFIACVPAPALAQSIDQSFYYKLSTDFRGTQMNLDVFNGGPKNNLTRLEPDQDVSGQFWRLKGNGDGTFRLLTMFRGSEMCLDVFNGGPNNNQPHLVKCGNYTGQFWNVLVTEDGDAVRLTTVFRGPSMCLDIFNGGPSNNQPHLAQCADLTGQRWFLTRTGERAEGTPRPHEGF
jgi:Ricin-type beta-trefoil lectin domain